MPVVNQEGVYMASMASDNKHLGDAAGRTNQSAFERPSTFEGAPLTGTEHTSASALSGSGYANEPRYAALIFAPPTNKSHDLGACRRRPNT